MQKSKYGYQVTFLEYRLIQIICYLWSIAVQDFQGLIQKFDIGIKVTATTTITQEKRPFNKHA